MTWVLLVAGPKNGQRFDMGILGDQVRYPEDDEDGGRYVWLGSSGDGGDLLYVWQEHTGA